MYTAEAENRITVRDIFLKNQDVLLKIGQLKVLFRHQVTDTGEIQSPT